jgi:protein tyrosine phosphatase
MDTCTSSCSSPDPVYELDSYNPLIRLEFEALKASSQCCDDLMKFASAVHPNNAHKNRYYNILANEDSRVRLAPLETGDEDYINANYIDGDVPNSKRAYILTQAPLPQTTSDFWRMVWQEKSPVIVCLTMLRENHKVKAHKYWPEDGQVQQYGKLFVLHNLSVLFKNIIVRLFSIWKDGDNVQPQPMEVLQLHYQDWPDFGTPSSTESIRALSSLLSALRDRRKQRNGESGPAIIHCSAGVGRAGTFVGIHITLAKLEHSFYNRGCSTSSPPISSLFEPQLSIKDMVAKLRRQRAGIVQTLDQYTFIYRAVADALQQYATRRNSGKRSEPDTASTISARDDISKDKVGVSAFLDILSGRPSKCSDSSTQGLSSTSEQLA